MLSISPDAITLTFPRIQNSEGTKNSLNDCTLEFPGTSSSVISLPFQEPLCGATRDQGKNHVHDRSFLRWQVHSHHRGHGLPGESLDGKAVSHQPESESHLYPREAQGRPDTAAEGRPDLK